MRIYITFETLPIGRPDPFSVRLRERRIIEEPGEESFDRIRCFSISPFIEGIGTRLQSVFTAVRFPQEIRDFSLSFLRDVFQNRPGCMNQTHLP